MNPQRLNEWADEIRRRRAGGAPYQIFVSLGTCGVAAGGGPVLDALRKAAAGRADVAIVATGCMGLCYCEPTVEVLDVASGRSVIYGDVKPEHAEAIVASGVAPAPGVKSVERTWYYPEFEANAKNALQARIVLRNSGRINPESLEDYIANQGYAALAGALARKDPGAVVQAILDSGLRGRGGGGFPTGKKWSICAEQKADQKYIICNADEGDPGAFMDRAVLEGDPHAVLEGMAIGGFAIGASKGVIYCRAEYPLAVKRLHTAIAQAREAGFLGNNLFDSGFDFDIEVKLGAGAFVCGEETALMSSIEGRRGMPNFKPPFPAIKGLFGKPTVINNVETFANVPPILRKGAAWFRTIGTASSPGTKVFSVTGKVNKVGLIEVPMGITLKDIVYRLADGIKGGKRFKAAQTGGPSGGCITEANLEVPIDYDTLRALGSMMGSGGMIVMDEDDCMVNVAKFFIGFTMEESCGKCTPCRIGGRQMHLILDRITEGNSTLADLDLLRELGKTMQGTSLCGLGMTAPNPVLSTLKNFEDEYMAHIKDKICPAGRCSKLVTFSIDPDLCTGCTACARKCPVSCIKGRAKEPHEIDATECIRCGACYDVCRFSAVLKNAKKTRPSGAIAS